MSSSTFLSKDLMLTEMEKAAIEFMDARRELIRATEELSLKKQRLEKCVADLAQQAYGMPQDIVVSISDPTSELLPVRRSN